MNMTAEKITEYVTVPMALSHYGYPTSSRRRIPCPLHSGKDPNFCYTDQVFHCWTCGAKGNVISLVMRLFGLSFPQALMKLNTDFALGLSAHKPTLRERQQMMESRKVQRAYEGMTEERKRLYRGLSVYHRELWRRITSGEADEGTVMLQQEVEAWLDENIGEVAVPWT
ncbi:CHC2 zinc finger domain-containing protein [Emergencia timonensis]|uniref:CHC2 zinc finger domain-containing protein n=1 Tax=Emergencia timonensis TaxID=1776384 RepID=UPI0039F45EC8